MSPLTLTLCVIDDEGAPVYTRTDFALLLPIHGKCLREIFSQFSHQGEYAIEQANYVPFRQPFSSYELGALPNLVSNA
jgi:hypothetical protein